jgi:hypothetical protein
MDNTYLREVMRGDAETYRDMFFYETVVTHPLTQKFGIFEYLTEYLLL